MTEAAGLKDTLLYEMEDGDPTLDEMMCFSKGDPTKSTPPGAHRHLHERQAVGAWHTSAAGPRLPKAPPPQARRPIARQKRHRVTVMRSEAVLRFQVQPEAGRCVLAWLSFCSSAGKAESFAAGQITLCHTPCQRPDSADISCPFGDTDRAPSIEQIEAV